MEYFQSQLGQYRRIIRGELLKSDVDIVSVVEEVHLMISDGRICRICSAIVEETFADVGKEFFGNVSVIIAEC